MQSARSFRAIIVRFSSSYTLLVAVKWGRNSNTKVSEALPQLILSVKHTITCCLTYHYIYIPFSRIHYFSVLSLFSVNIKLFAHCLKYRLIINSMNFLINIFQTIQKNISITISLSLSLSSVLERNWIIATTFTVPATNA